MKVLFTLAVFCSLILALGAHAQNTDPLVVGIKEAPPFVIKQEDDSYTGLSVELWERIASANDLAYRYQESDLEGLFNGLQNGSLDASIGALTVTVPREEIIDFSHPFQTTGLAIAVPEKGNAVLLTLKRLFSLEFLASLTALVGVLMLVGFLLWLAERKKNKEQFGGPAASGIGASFWWAAVTMTTVGYGDKAPVTFWGRIVALVWMFAAIIIISSFTAAIATSLTVGQLESAVTSVQDLNKVRVATVSPSASEEFLKDNGIGYETRSSVTEAVAALADGKVDAVVYDRPILQYLIKQSANNTRVLPNTFQRQDYAIALPEGSPMREEINHALLEVITSEQWQRVLNRYLGAEN